jgi:Recombination endonuclease VII
MSNDAYWTPERREEARQQAKKLWEEHRGEITAAMRRKPRTVSPRREEFGLPRTPRTVNPQLGDLPTEVEVDWVEHQLLQQHNLCGICHKPFTSSRRFFVDHDHSSERCSCGSDQRCGFCRRGLLCHTCNAGLGMFQDDIRTLANAIVYLETFMGTQCRAINATTQRRCERETIPTTLFCNYHQRN